MGKKKVKRQVAALRAQVETLAAELGALRASMAAEVRTQKVVIVDGQRSTVIEAAQATFENDDPEVGSRIVMYAMDLGAGVHCQADLAHERRTMDAPRYDVALVASTGFEPTEAGVRIIYDDVWVAEGWPYPLAEKVSA